MSEAIPKYPDNVDDNESLIEVKDNKESQLTAAVDDIVTIIEVNDISGFPTAGYISIDDEIIRYEEIDGNKFGTVAKPCLRGAQGTVAIQHDAGDKTYLNVTSIHHNVLKDTIIKIEEELGTLPKAGYTDVKERIEKLLEDYSVGPITPTEISGKKVFESPSAYISGKLEVYINGLLELPITELSDTQFELDIAIEIGDTIKVKYIRKP